LMMVELVDMSDSSEVGRVAPPAGRSTIGTSAGVEPT
jgi:hypothetical protein